MPNISFDTFLLENFSLKKEINKNKSLTSTACLQKNWQAPQWMLSQSLPVSPVLAPSARYFQPWHLCKVAYKKLLVKVQYMILYLHYNYITIHSSSHMMMNPPGRAVSFAIYITLVLQLGNWKTDTLPVNHVVGVEVHQALQSAMNDRCDLYFLQWFLMHWERKTGRNIKQQFPLHHQARIVLTFNLNTIASDHVMLTWKKQWNLRRIKTIVNLTEIKKKSTTMKWFFSVKEPV